MPPALGTLGEELVLFPMNLCHCNLAYQAIKELSFTNQKKERKYIYLLGCGRVTLKDTESRGEISRMGAPHSEEAEELQQPIHP